MAKKSKLSDVETELVRTKLALSEARKGLFRIININPATYVTGPAGSGGSLPIVRAFHEAQSVADRTVIAISDAEEPDA